MFYALRGGSGLVPPREGWRCFSGQAPPPTVVAPDGSPSTGAGAGGATAQPLIDAVAQSRVHRQRVYDELLTTEETFLKDLELVGAVVPSSTRSFPTARRALGAPRASLISTPPAAL